MQELLDAFGGARIHLGRRIEVGQRTFLVNLKLYHFDPFPQDSEVGGCLFQKADIKHYKNTIVSHMFSRTNGSLIVYSGDVSDNWHILQVTPKVKGEIFNLFWTNSIPTYNVCLVQNMEPDFGQKRVATISLCEANQKMICDVKGQFNSTD